MIAYGINQDGHREILGFGVYDNESKHTWNAFLQSLKDRGLKDLLMITSTASEPSQRRSKKKRSDWQSLPIRPFFHPNGVPMKTLRIQDLQGFVFLLEFENKIQI